MGWRKKFKGFLDFLDQIHASVFCSSQTKARVVWSGRTEINIRGEPNIQHFLFIAAIFKRSEDFYLLSMHITVLLFLVFFPAGQHGKPHTCLGRRNLNHLMTTLKCLCHDGEVFRILCSL